MYKFGFRIVFYDLARVVELKYIMPLKVVCSECSYILCEGDYLKSPSEIMKKYEGSCPKCGSPLDPSAYNINIFPNKENK